MPENVVAAPLDMHEIATVLVKHYGLHSGQYNLLIEFQFGISNIGPDPKVSIPGVMVGIKKLGLIPHTEEQSGPFTIDAAVVNPA